MLCQFSFKNFKSYREETTFDLRAVNLPEFSDSLILGGKADDLLPVSVFYGPNGGGKSNVLQALACLISTVIKPVLDLGTTRVPIIMHKKVECVPFLLDATSRDEPTEFLIFFRTAENEFRYYLSLLRDEVVAESLSRKKLGGKKTALIFDRERGGISLGASIRRGTINTAVNTKMPYLSFLAINYNLPVIAEVQEWFESCIIRNYADPRAEQSIMVAGDEKLQKRIVTFLNDMGIDIDGYRFDADDRQLYLQRSIQGRRYELPFAAESDGTKKLIAALPMVLLALMEGRLTIVDELDAKLHPKLLRYLISLFKNPEINTRGAQLIFTAHDVSIMKKTVFRRDEIWFAAEDETHNSIIYSLHEIRREDNERVNHTAAYDKQYLEGRYGADPYLQNMLTGGDWQ